MEVSEHRAVLGEAPHWDPARSELIHVDILGREVLGWRPGRGVSWRFTVDGEVSAAIPWRDGGLLLAVEQELRVRRGDGSERTIARVLEPPDVRFNDCRCDPHGRLWAGTMSRRRRPRSSALHRLEEDGRLEPVLGGTTISNGLGWSPDGARMYFVDSPTQRVDVLDYDVPTGAVAGRRPFADIDPGDGMPDGLTVDAEGGVWVCLFGGGAVRRYGPEGELDEHLALPVTYPTAPVFGDDDLRTLYVTSARHWLSEGELAAQPAAGALLGLRPGVAGLAGGSPAYSPETSAGSTNRRSIA